MADIGKMIQKEAESLRSKTPRSMKLFERASWAMPNGIPNDVYYLDPYPIAISGGQGAYTEDIDGNRYLDYALGFGVSVFGHANPEITQAIKSRAERGVHFGTTSEEATLWAEALKKKFNTSWVRFSNSGSEATLDAIRIARARTSRNKIVKIDGAYHGSHDYALVGANYPEPEDLERFDFRPWGGGLSPRLAEEVIAIPWNDLRALEEALLKEDAACFILEPILFNVGAIWPDSGYHEGVRDLCDRYGTLLIWDETKTGHSVAYGGSEELFGVRADLKTAGKGIGGGIPCGAIMGRDIWGAEIIEEGVLPQLGTFSGNPLASAAGVAALDFMTPEKYLDLERHRLRLTQGIHQIRDEYDLPCYSTGAGAKQCLVWATGELRNYRDYLSRFDFDLGLLTWIWMMNRGIWLAQGQDEQTTHSVYHGDAEADRFLETFEDLAKEIA